MKDDSLQCANEFLCENSYPLPDAEGGDGRGVEADPHPPRVQHPPVSSFGLEPIQVGRICRI